MSTKKQNWITKYISKQLLTLFIGLFLIFLSSYFGYFLYSIYVNQTNTWAIIIYNIWLIFWLINVVLFILFLVIKLQEYQTFEAIFEAEKQFEANKNKNRIFLEIVKSEQYSQKIYKNWFTDLDFGLYKNNDNYFYSALNQKLKPHSICIDNIWQDKKLKTIISLDSSIYNIFEQITKKHFENLKWQLVQDPFKQIYPIPKNKNIIGSCIGHSQWTVQLYLFLPWANDNQTPNNNFWKYIDLVLEPQEKVIWQYIFDFGNRKLAFQQQLFQQKEQQIYDQLKIEENQYNFFLNALYPQVDKIHSNKYANRLLPNNILVQTGIKVMIICNPDRYSTLEKELEKAIYNYFWDCNLEKVCIASTNQIAFNEVRKSINPEIQFIYDRMVALPEWFLLLFKKQINLTYYYNENKHWRQKITKSIYTRQIKTGWSGEFSLLDSDFISSIFNFPKIKD
jgi:hypothetical protein